jgi:hypothetical protein
VCDGLLSVAKASQTVPRVTKYACAAEEAVTGSSIVGGGTSQHVIR